MGQIRTRRYLGKVIKKSLPEIVLQAFDLNVGG